MVSAGWVRGNGSLYEVVGGREEAPPSIFSEKKLMAGHKKTLAGLLSECFFYVANFFIYIPSTDVP